MDKHSGEFPVDLMSTTIGVSKSGFYTWKRRKNADDAKAQNRYELARAIEDIHKSSRKSYGSPRVFKQLRALGFKVSKATVEKIMREEGIVAKSKRKFKVTTDSKHNHPVADNILNRKFNEVKSTNQVWVSDITYIATREGFLYLATVMDLFSRKIVGWSMKSTMSQDLVIDALDMAYKREKPARGLLHHSDRGSQYASKAYQKRLWRYGMICSMSRKGNCWDNSPMESFFRSLKVEHVYHEDFATRIEARLSIFDWIEIFYNRQRLHSSLGYKTPVEIERQLVLEAA